LEADALKPFKKMIGEYVDTVSISYFSFLPWKVYKLSLHLNFGLFSAVAQ
jgi:hypothetical protein